MAQSDIGFEANPDFFSSKSDSQRCKAIDLWFDSVRVVTGTPMKSPITIGGDRFRSAAMPAFVGIFGRYFEQLSEGEIESISKSVKKCVSDEFLARLVGNDLLRNASGWKTASERFQRLGDSRLKDRVEASREKSAQVTLGVPCANEKVTPETSRNVLYSIGPLLLNTDSYSVYGERIRYPSDCWYSQFGEARISVIFKGNDLTTIPKGDDFRLILTEKIIPLIKDKVYKVRFVSVINHIDGYFIAHGKLPVKDSSGDEFAKVHTSSVPLSLVTYSKFDDNPENYNYVGEKLSIAEFRRWTETNIAAAKIERKRKELEDKVLLEKRKVDERRNAAEVLALVRHPSGPSPKNYDFSGSKDGVILEAIYTGNFSRIREDSDYDLKTILDSAKKFDLERIRQMYLRVATLNFLYMAYHDAYEIHCSANKDISRRDYFYTSPIEVRLNWLGRELGRSGGSTTKFVLRKPFGPTYVDKYAFLNELDPMVAYAIAPAFSATAKVKPDLSKFILAEKCSSPALRLFEVNLYLLVNMMLPMQELVAS